VAKSLIKEKEAELSSYGYTNVTVLLLVAFSFLLYVFMYQPARFKVASIIVSLLAVLVIFFVPDLELKLLGFRDDSVMLSTSTSHREIRVESNGFTFHLHKSIAGRRLRFKDLLVTLLVSAMGYFSLSFASHPSFHRASSQYMHVNYAALAPLWPLLVFGALFGYTYNIDTNRPYTLCALVLACLCALPVGGTQSNCIVLGIFGMGLGEQIRSVFAPLP